MSGSTGTPMNLNTLDGTDDVVKALTDLFNQNMNLINSGDAHIKIWKPNTAYQQYDIVRHPYHDQLIYASKSHTSSNSTAEDDWSMSDGPNWISLSQVLNINQWLPDRYYSPNDLFLDGNELKRANVSGSSKALDKSMSTFIGSRVALWTPNTLYNTGDLAYIKSLNLDDVAKGSLKGSILRCTMGHTSTTIFPAASAGLWELINIESFARTDSFSFGFGRPLTVSRVGNTQTMGYIASKSTGRQKAGRASMNERLPEWCDLSLRGADQTIYIGQSPFDGDAQGWQLAIHGNAANLVTLYVKNDVDSGSAFRGQSTVVTDSQILWEAGMPVQ